MPEKGDKEALEKAREDLAEGKASTTAAGEFVREEIHHVREGKHGARSPKQAIAIGLSKARRAGMKLPPPAPELPGPFSLGPQGVMEDMLRRAGFHDVLTRTIRTPLRVPSAAECVRFERESFGALQHMLVGLAEPEREAAWDEIEQELHQFQGRDGF